MELCQLTYCVAVVEDLHFGRAAARVHIAPRALSMQIQALEWGMAVAPCVRTTRQVELTVVGETFCGQWVRILRDIDMSAQAKRSADGKAMQDQDRHEASGYHRRFVCILVEDCPKISGHPAADPERLDQRYHPQLGNRPVQSRFHPSGGEYSCPAVLLDCQSRMSVGSRQVQSAAGLAEIGIEALLDQKFISSSRQKLSYTDRYFSEHDLVPVTFPIAATTRSPISLVSDGLGIGFAPQDEGFSQPKFRTLKGEGREFQDPHGLPGSWRIRPLRGTR
jgi:hypothetical protein